MSVTCARSIRDHRHTNGLRPMLSERSLTALVISEITVLQLGLEDK